MRRFLTGTNYCGPGGDGETLGELDEACKAHDEAYTAPYLFDYLANQKADSLFLQRVRSSRPRGYRQRVTKFVADRYFSLKTSLVHVMSGHLRSNDQGQVLIPNSGFKRRKLVDAGPNKRKFLAIAPPGGAYKRVQRALPYYMGKRFVGRRPFAGRRYAPRPRYFKKRIYRFRRRYRS